MNKYRLQKKLQSTKLCAFYLSENKQSREHYLIKQLLRSATWEQTLKSKQLTLMKKNDKNKYLSNVIEIIKEDSSYYYVLQEMKESLAALSKTQPSHQIVVKVARSLIQMITYFHEIGIIPKEIRSAQVFIVSGTSTVKLAHLQTVRNSQAKARLDVIELQDMSYLAPQQVLTTLMPDEKASVFNVGLLICELITGKVLINAKNKIDYMYQLCRLFPGEEIDKVEKTEHSLKHEASTELSFQKIFSKYNLSNEFIALLREMLRFNRNERIHIHELLESFELITENEEAFQRDHQLREEGVKEWDKPHNKQVPINKEIFKEVEFTFESIPTLSATPILKPTSDIIPFETNINDTIIKPKASKRQSKSLGINFENIKGRTPKHIISKTFHKEGVLGALKGRTMKNKTLSEMKSTDLADIRRAQASSVRRPQLTNYAKNLSHAEVLLGFNETNFNERE